MRIFQLFRPRSATCLSGSALARAASRPFVGLARLSLLAACLLTLSSCLVDDPPPFPESKQTPPRLDLHNAVPRPNDVIVAQSGTTLHFTIPVASEDAGDGLIALLFVDYSGGAATRAAARVLDPSTLDDLTRVVGLDWLVVSSPGCHLLTLRVTHNRNIDTTSSPLLQNPADLAEAYWWAVVDPDPSVGMVDCPTALGGPP